MIAVSRSGSTLTIEYRSPAVEGDRTSFVAIGSAVNINLAIYAKEFTSNSWGRFFGCNDPTVGSGTGDRYIPTFLRVDLAASSDKIVSSHARLGGTKLRVYQLFVRLFGNTK